MDRSALRPEPGGFRAAEHMKHLVCAQILNVAGEKERKNTECTSTLLFFFLLFFYLKSKLWLRQWPVKVT